MPQKSLKWKSKKRNKSAKWRKIRKKGLAAKIKKIQQQLYAQADDRWIDIVQGSMNIPSGGVTVDLMLLNSIAQGNNITQREGNKISLKTFSFKGMITCADLYNIVRIMIVKIPQPDNSLPNINDILSSLPPAVPATWDSPYKKNSDTKFKILYDKTHWLQAHQGYTYYPSRKQININLNFHELPVHYNAPTAGIPTKNGIYMIAVSDSGIATHPTLEGKGRLTFSG